jgi:sRNA-binding carbon storage regulator CsrA
MLIFTRYVHEKIHIGKIVVEVQRIEGKQVRLAISALRRGEIETSHKEH